MHIFKTKFNDFYCIYVWAVKNTVGSELLVVYKPEFLNLYLKQQHTTAGKHMCLCNDLWHC